MGDAHHCSEPVSEMTYTVSSGTLNSTIPYLNRRSSPFTYVSFECFMLFDRATLIVLANYFILCVFCLLVVAG